MGRLWNFNGHEILGKLPEYLLNIFNHEFIIFFFFLVRFFRALQIKLLAYGM